MYLFLYYTYLVHYNLRNYALFLGSFAYAFYEERCDIDKCSRIVNVQNSSNCKYAKGT
jgi:hypothetical protein